MFPVVTGELLYNTFLKAEVLVKGWESNLDGYFKMSYKDIITTYTYFTNIQMDVPTRGPL